jgi:hypothetical protein
MQRLALFLGAVFLAASAYAQPAVSSADHASPAPDTAAQAGPSAGTPPDEANRPSPPPDGPSLDRIREALKTEPALQIERPVDYHLEIRERGKLVTILESMKFTSGPPAAAGWYGYEQQRLAFPPTSRPLAQPYAAFSGAELLTIAFQNVLGYYLAGKYNDYRHNEAQRDAADEGAAEIAAYCAARPDRHLIAICQ